MATSITTTDGTQTYSEEMFQRIIGRAVWREGFVSATHGMYMLRIEDEAHATVTSPAKFDVGTEVLILDDATEARVTFLNWVEG